MKPNPLDLLVALSNITTIGRYIDKTVMMIIIMIMIMIMIMMIMMIMMMMIIIMIMIPRSLEVYS